MKNKSYPASVLVVSLIIMGVILAIALSVSARAIIERKAAMSGAKSDASFQVAESGVESVLQTIRDKGGASAISTIATSGCPGSPQITGSVSSGSYTVYFLDKDGNRLTDCTQPIATINQIKSTGTYAYTSRVIQAAVAAGGLVWTDASFNNEWVNNQAGYQTVQYAKDPTSNLVYIRGLAYRATNTGGSNCVFHLPSGYIPQKQVTFAGWGIAPASPWIIERIDVLGYSTSDPGCVEIFALGLTSYATLDGIVFSTD